MISIRAKNHQRWFCVLCTVHLDIKSNKDQSGSIIQFEFSFFFCCVCTHLSGHIIPHTLGMLVILKLLRTLWSIWMLECLSSFWFRFFLCLLLRDGGIIHIKSLHLNQDSKHIVNGKWYLISVLFLCIVFAVVDVFLRVV